MRSRREIDDEDMKMLKDKRNWHLDGVKPAQKQKTNLENGGKPSVEGQTSVDEEKIDSTWNARRNTQQTE
jgi:hypothetical protein